MNENNLKCWGMSSHKSLSKKFCGSNISLLSVFLLSRKDIAFSFREKEFDFNFESRNGKIMFQVFVSPEAASSSKTNDGWYILCMDNSIIPKNFVSTNDENGLTLSAHGDGAFFFNGFFLDPEDFFVLATVFFQIDSNSWPQYLSENENWYFADYI